MEVDGETFSLVATCHVICNMEMQTRCCTVPKKYGGHDINCKNWDEKVSHALLQVTPV